ncbi:putative amidase [Plectosphaerella plurivora]|uniref:Amidase n=1 Tax=Plectosphaerella plurivora TaxID=936078 RepID=A0A9P9A7M9_9PEZI|nr:putative amidase [Plectosphaerella plurivora]
MAGRFLRASCVLLYVSLVGSTSGLNIVEASIEDLQTALKNGQINAVQLTAKHLHRVAQYDRRGPRLNAIPVINPLVFDHAQASDTYRALNGTIRSDLEGLPGTLKDSYMMEGMTVASGSPALVNLAAKEDAFTTSQLRSAGGIILGKTNMPPMANGGMQRGVYGRAESPYNKEYLAAAYASGSSNGAGASTASSMGVFAMAEETVSSGRSPASNNGLVAYTPSRGVLSIRGNWPLFPVADVEVPYARTVKDMFSVLDVIVKEDKGTTSDFWRGQPFISLPSPEDRLGVPKMYIGGNDPKAIPIWVSPAVQKLWQEARITLEALGATVDEVDFPLVTEREAPGQEAWDTEYPLPGRKPSDSPGPHQLAPYSWDDFLHMVDRLGLDAVVFPAAGDVGREDAETNDASAVHAWRNGVFFSNGNYAIRQNGVPTVTTTMGILSDIEMPLGLTFASKAYDDNALLSYAYAFETAHAKRIAPPLTPTLPTDEIKQLCVRRSLIGTQPPTLTAEVQRLCGNIVEVSGTVDVSASGALESVEVTVDGVIVGPVTISEEGRWSILTRTVPFHDAEGDVPVRFVNNPDQSLAMITVVATAKNGRSDGKLLFV